MTDLLVPTPAATFSSDEIELARQLQPRLKDFWHPAAGHFVFDPDRIVQKSSPFQSQVFFVLNYSYFMTLVGGVDEFRRRMVWLPSWQQARQLADQVGIEHDAIIERCLNPETIAAGDERLSLYRLLFERTN